MIQFQLIRPPFQRSTLCQAIWTRFMAASKQVGGQGRNSKLRRL